MARKAEKLPLKLSACPNSTLEQTRPVAAQSPIMSLSNAALRACVWVGLGGGGVGGLGYWGHGGGAAGGWAWLV